MLGRMLSDERWSKLRMIMLQHRIYDKPNFYMLDRRDSESADERYDEDDPVRRDIEENPYV